MVSEKYYRIYRIVDGLIVYDRTCGAEWAADDRVEELIKRGNMAFWCFVTIKEAYY